MNISHRPIQQLFLRILAGIVLATAFHPSAMAQTPSRVDRYAATPFMATWTDISTTGDTFHYNKGDAGWGTITMPFDFPYDDSIIPAGSTIRVGANGSIALSSDTTPDGPTLDSIGYPGVVCPFNGLVVEGTGHANADSDFYEVDGTAPNRVLTVQYHFMHIPGTGSGGGGGGTGGNANMMQVKFYETTGAIEFIYQTHNNPFEAKPIVLCGIGLNGFVKSGFVASFYGTNFTATPPTDIRWTPGAAGQDSVVVVQPFASPACAPELDTETVTVTNTGTNSTSYQGTIAGAFASDFTILEPNPSTVESAGGVATFHVVFNPSTSRTEFANFIVTKGPGGSVPMTAAGAASVSGAGTAPLTMVGSTSNFSVTVNNSGTCDWTPGTVTVDPPFAYVSGGNTVIPAGGAGTLNFSFTPTTVGQAAPQIVFFSNSIGVSVPAANVVISGSAEASDVKTVSEADGYSIDQNYPNPFSEESQLTITLPTSGLVSLSIFDDKGQLAQTVLDRSFDAGSYIVTLRADALPSGTYYCRMNTGGVTLTRQIVVVK